MVEEVVNNWENNKHILRERFEEIDIQQLEYSDIIKNIVKIILEEYESESITEVNDGSYQGTLIYLIPPKNYQPMQDDYLVTYIDYGSCTGCDTLISIQFDSEDKKQQIDDLMTLSLHMIQNMKKLY